MPKRNEAPPWMIAAVKETLLRKWDPIEIQDEPLAHDEYDSYIRVICRLLIEERGAAILANHLLELETVSMGLNGNYNHCLLVAYELLKLSSRRT